MSDKQQGETIVIVARFINEQQNYYDGHVLLLKEGATRILYLRTFLLSISWTSRVMPNMRTYQGKSSWPTCPIRNFSKIKKLLIEGSSFTLGKRCICMIRATYSCWLDWLLLCVLINQCGVFSPAVCVTSFMGNAHKKSVWCRLPSLSRGKSDEIFIANKTDRWLPVPKSRRRDIVGINPPVRIEILWNCGFCVHRFSQRPSLLLNLCTYCMYILPHEII